MPGSTTTPDRSGARSSAPVRVAFRFPQSVSARDQTIFAAQYLAYVLPYRRFADMLAQADARLGADVVCYSFIAVDLHHLLLASLLAHAGVRRQRPPAASTRLTSKPGVAAQGFWTFTRSMVRQHAKPSSDLFTGHAAGH